MPQEKTKIRMRKTQTGSPDGIKVNTYEKGKTYILPRDLAKVFVNELKVAEIVKDRDSKVVEIVKAKAPKQKTQ